MAITAWEIAKQSEARAGFLLSQSFISDFSKYRHQLQLRIEEEAKDWALHARLMWEIAMEEMDNEG